MRRASLSRLTERHYDILVVGGGIYGAMVARDAALRGLRTALIERGDFGAETSHNSMKIIHGGIRYVQHLDFSRLRASAREREFWQRCAPEHLRPLAFLMPLIGYGVRGPLAFGAAAAIYNAASASARGDGYPAARVIGPAAARRRLGAVAPDGLTGGGLWSDGQVVDANRLQIACVAAAAEQGCDVANYTEAVGLSVHRGRVVGARIRDSLGGSEGEIRATMTVSCTGPGAVDIAHGAVPAIAEARFPSFVRAMNLVLDRPPPESGLGLVGASPADGVVARGNRLYFLTPWKGKTILGTHEAPHGGGAAWCPTPKDIAAFLEEVNATAPALDLRMGEVCYVYGGLIPAEAGVAEGTARRRRRGTLLDHEAEDGVAGLISAIGVKYTSARLVAERVVDLAAARVRSDLPASRSFETPLPAIGAAPPDPHDGAALRRRVWEAVRTEMAMTLDDLAVRRTRLAETGALTGAGGSALLQQAARMAADELGWNEARLAREISYVEQRLGRTRPAARESPALARGGS